MFHVEPYGADQRSNCKAGTATSANPVKTKSNNKIPQDAKRPAGVVNPTGQASPTNVNRTGPTGQTSPANVNRTGQLSAGNTNRSKGTYQNTAPTGRFSRRARQEQRMMEREMWNAMLPQLMVRLGLDLEPQLKAHAPSEDDRLRLDRCFGAVQATLGELGSRWRLEIFGSVASGFSTCTSDMDATCVLGPAEAGAEEGALPDAKSTLIDKLSPAFRELPAFEVIEEIPFAKVPILRLRFEEKLDIDLSCQNTAALENTRLLRAYADFDARVQDLGVAVKLWAKAANVCGAAQSKLSSYAFTLLAIYFMQVHPDVKLPCLKPALFAKDSDPDVANAAIAAAKSAWSCPLSLPELLYRFVGFYYGEFEWGREVVCIRHGDRRYCRDSAFNALRGRYVSRIHIEDPYVLERNLHCVLGDPEEGQLREAIRVACETLFSGGTPVGLHPVGGPPGGQKMELQLSELTTQFSPQSSPEVGPAKSPQLSFLEMTSGEEVFSGAGAFLQPLVVKGPVSAKAGNATESPGTFSSAGSTESGTDGVCESSSSDECAAAKPHRATPPVCNGGYQEAQTLLHIQEEENQEAPKQWWQNLASTDVKQGLWEQAQREAAAAARPRVISLADLEHQMVHKQDIAAIGKALTPGGSPPGGPAQDPQVDMPNNSWWLNLGSANVVQAVGAKQEVPIGKQERRKSSGVVTLQDLEQQLKLPEDSALSVNTGITPLFGGPFGHKASSRIASRITKKYFA